MPVSLENLPDTMPQQKLSIVTGLEVRSNPLIKATFLANSPCIVSRLNLFTTATFFLSKVAVGDRLNCTLCATEYIRLLGVFQERKVQQVVRVFFVTSQQVLWAVTRHEVRSSLNCIYKLTA